MVVRVLGGGPLSGVRVAFTVVPTVSSTRAYFAATPVTTTAGGTAALRLVSTAVAPPGTPEVFTLEARLPDFPEVPPAVGTFSCVTPIFTQAVITNGDTITSYPFNILARQPVVELRDQFGDVFTLGGAGLPDCETTVGFVGQPIAAYGPGNGDPHYRFYCAAGLASVPRVLLSNPAFPAAGQVTINVREVATNTTRTATLSLATRQLPVLSSFRISLQGLRVLPLNLSNAIDAASAEWSARALVEDIPDVTSVLPGITCSGVALPPAQGVDDVLAYVDLVPLDGPGGLLGKAFVCEARAAGGFPIRGVILIDSADYPTLSFGQLVRLAMHEMGHVLGFGSWDLFPGVVDTGAAVGACRPSGCRASWVGAAAQQAGYYVGAGGASLGCDLPNTQSTACLLPQNNVHWDDATFSNELMSPVARSSLLSRVTINALRDMGYGVTDAFAESYSAPMMSGAESGLGSTPIDRVVPWRPALLDANGVVVVPGRARR